MVVKCLNNKIFVDVASIVSVCFLDLILVILSINLCCFMRFQLDSPIGLTADVSVRDVADQAGNKSQVTTVWGFTVADFGASAASVHVTGLILNVSSASINNAAPTAIKSDLVPLLGVADTRFTALWIAEIGIPGVSVTTLEFTITASSYRAATSLAQQLAEAVLTLASGSNAMSKLKKKQQLAKTQITSWQKSVLKLGNLKFRWTWLLVCSRDRCDQPRMSSIEMLLLVVFATHCHCCDLICNCSASGELSVQWCSSCSWTY
jgi:hypothetical protein